MTVRRGVRYSLVGSTRELRGGEGKVEGLGVVAGRCEGFAC